MGYIEGHIGGFSRKFTSLRLGPAVHHRLSIGLSWRMALAVRVAHLDSCHEIAEAWALQSQQVAQPPTVQQVNFNFVNRQALTQLFTLVGTTFWLSLPLPKSRSKSRNRTGQQDEKSKALYRAEPGQCDSMWQDWFKNIADSGRVAGQAP